ncbi:MAG: Gfo/Idh/MocA family oxidoreductase [Gemmatimonadota bacterium]
MGCGHIARTVHCPNVAALPGAAIAAYCDVDESRARALLAEHGGEYATTSAHRVIGDPSLDGVLLMVGPERHPALVQAAARAGKHVFCEKPIALELADALETVRVVEESGARFQYGTCCRLAPGPLAAARRCPRPLYSYAQCADTVTHQAAHNLDLAVHLFHRAPLVRVYASGGQHWGLDPHLPADSFAAVLTFADGSTHTYLQHGRAYNALLRKFHYQLFGTDVCVMLARRFKECHAMRGPDEAERVWGFDGGDWDLTGPDGYMGHYRELEELAACIREGGKRNGSLTVRQAAYVLAVEKAILRSVETGAVVDFAGFLEESGGGFLARGPHP